MRRPNVISRITTALMAITFFLTISHGLQARDIRMMSYNIRNATGLDGKIDTRRIASVIDSVAPDVVAIQEIDSITGRSHGRNLLAEIAGYAGMRHVYAPAIDFDGGK